MDIIIILGIISSIVAILTIPLIVDWIYEKYKEWKRGKCPFKDYINYLIEDFEKDELSKYYVDLKAEKKDGEKIKTFNSIDNYINEWLTKEDKNQISILGEYGTGKTSFCRKYAHDMAIKYKNKESNRLPVLINLRNYVKVNNLEELIVNMFRIYDSGFSYSTFDKMNNEGKVLLILDGFDEMAQKTKEDTLYSNFEEISRFITPKSKVILTSRTEYFKDHLEEIKVLGSDKKEIIIWCKANFEILYLKLFDHEQIKEFLQKIVPVQVPFIKGREHGWKYYYDKIKDKRMYDLYELSHRAVLLYMIIKTLPQLMEQKKTITVASIYNNYIEGELDRLTVIKKLSPIIKRETRIELMKGLASYMLLNDILNVHYTKISDVEEIKNFFSDIKNVTKDDPEPYLREFLVCSFLIRDADGNYHFSHKSFMEFFCAKKFSDEIKNKNKNNFGRKQITKEIESFLVELIRDENYSDILFEFIDYTKHRTLKESEKYICMNAVNVLKLLGKSFSKKDFSNADLTQTNFRNAILKNANLNNTVLENTNFSYADLEGATFGEMGAVSSLFVTADKKHIVSGGSDDTIKIWDFEKGECIRTLKGHNSSVYSVFVTADKKHIVSGSSDGTIKIWDFEKGEEIRTLKGYNDSVYSVFVTADKEHIVSGSSDKTIKVWDFEKGEEIRTLKGHNNVSECIFVTSDKKHIVSGSWDRTIKIWDFEKGEEIRTLKGHNGYVSSVFVTADKKHIVSGSWDKTIKIWDFEKGEEIRTLKGHNGYVLSVFVTADKKHIVSGSWDKTIKIWDFEKGEEIRTLEQKMECKGMNIKHAKGLSEEQIKFLKERRAIEI